MKNKIKNRKQITLLAKKLKSKCKKIVTTNGCFDILHVGHIHLLQEAKKQGDILIVGINSDSSIKKYKGDLRPIIPEKYRAQMISALKCVDYVSIFNETESIDFIKSVRPDVHVKLKENYQQGLCTEAPYVLKNGGKMHLIDKVSEFSTTKIINKILKIYQKGNQK